MLLCNQREAAAIAGLSNTDPRGKWDRLNEAVCTLLAAGTPLVVVTLGREGAFAATADTWYARYCIGSSIATPNLYLSSPQVVPTGC